MRHIWLQILDQQLLLNVTVESQSMVVVSYIIQSDIYNVNSDISCGHMVQQKTVSYCHLNTWYKVIVKYKIFAGCKTHTLIKYKYRKKS